MESKKIAMFMQLAGQETAKTFTDRGSAVRELGAQLLLSEVLEYVIKGLGVVPEFNGVKITDPNGLSYKSSKDVDQLEMLDGLADVAYTMYWNSEAFGLPLEEVFEKVCDNNLEKFVKIEEREVGLIAESEWDCGLDVKWPDTVASVEVVKVGDSFYAVGKDQSGKVRKPSTYSSVSLEEFLK